MKGINAEKVGSPQGVVDTFLKLLQGEVTDLVTYDLREFVQLLFDAYVLNVGSRYSKEIQEESEKATLENLEDLMNSEDLEPHVDLLRNVQEWVESRSSVGRRTEILIFLNTARTRLNELADLHGVEVDEPFVAEAEDELR